MSAFPTVHTARGCHHAKADIGQHGDDIADGYIPTSILELSGLSAKQRLWDTDVILNLVNQRIGNLGGNPVAIPIPWNTDGAGIAYPAGTVLCLAGSPSKLFLSATNIVTPAGLSGSSGVVSHSAAGTTNSLKVRAWIGRVIFVTGAKPGTVGTIVVKRFANYGSSSGGGEVVLQTVTIDGDDGPEQQISLPDVYLPDTNIAGNQLLYYASSWVGTLPTRVLVVTDPWGLSSGWICPTAAPASGHTEVVDLGAQNRTYDVGLQNSPLAVGNLTRLGEFGRLADAWTRAETPLGWRSTAAPTCRRFGIPSTQIIHDTTSQRPEFSFNSVSGEFQANSPPGIFIGANIREMTWWPAAKGMNVESADVTISRSVSGLAVPTTYDVVTSWQTVSVGPGWRNVRIWLVSKDADHAKMTINSSSLEYRLDSGAETSVNIHGIVTDGINSTFIDVAGPLDSSRMNGLLQIRLKMNVTFGTTDFLSAQIIARVAASPRVDIPPPWRFPGRGCDTVGGYYKDASLTDILPLGGVLHVAAGSATVSWTVAETYASETTSRLISFVCATTGFWRVVPPGGGTINTLGEYESRNHLSRAMVGRAGKRFFGGTRGGAAATLNGTWTLTAVTPVYKVILGAGTTVASGITFDSFFGTIALPAAGTYNIWAKISTSDSRDGCSIRLLGSLTDAFCAEPALIDERYQTATIALFGITSLAAPPGSPSAALRYRIIAPATGAWVGKEGSIAAFVSSAWLFIKESDMPIPSTAVLDSVMSIWDGATWTAASGIKVINATITVDAAATLYIRATNQDDEALMFLGSAQVNLPQGGVTLGWEAV